MKDGYRNAKWHFQMTFSLPSTSCLLKLPTAIALRTATGPRLNMTNHMTRHRSSALYGAGIMGAYFLLIFNTHISFQSSVVQSPFDNWHSSFSPTTFWNSCIRHKWIVLLARADWLARGCLSKYYSPPSSRRETKCLPVSLRFPKKKFFQWTRRLYRKTQKWQESLV